MSTYLESFFSVMVRFMLYLQKLIITFLEKYFFILKAASDGWRIVYVGGNQFKFINTRTLKNKNTRLYTNCFIDRYTPKLLSQLL
jgi:hypothetical protein